MELELAEAEEEGAASLNPIIMLIIGLVIGLIIGFFAGRFGKKAAKMAKDAAKAAGAAAKAAAADSGESSAVQDEDDEMDEDAKDDMLSKFLDTTQSPGIDDNPDCEFNPIWEYKIKRQKELDRIEFLRKRAEEEGLDMDEAVDAGGGGAPGGRQNALATLIECGARVTSVMSADSAAAQAAQAHRRTMKNIETFLVKQMDVEVSSVKVEKGKRMEENRKLTAYEKAMETAKQASLDERTQVSMSSAKASRLQLREILRRRPEINVEPSKEDAPETQKGVSADDLAAQQLMSLEGDDEAEGEENEDEDEGGDEPEGEQLVA